MSGTSLDGLDLVVSKFVLNKNKWEFSILLKKTHKYSSDWIKRLKTAIYLNKTELLELDINYSKYLAQIINDFTSNKKIKIDFLSSHGHTVFHEPKKGLTYQIGNNRNLSDLTSKTLVCDFRSQDVSLGGQGAPLVPVGDYYLFSDYSATLNLGGFANITKLTNPIIAYDICPVNTVLNFLSGKLKLSYDDRGKMASEGKIINKMFNELNLIKFYDFSPPKSLGIEWVKEEIDPILTKYEKFPVKDLLHTFVIHIALKISSQFPSEGKILVTGGGVYNEFLINQIKKKSKCELIKPSSDLIEFKEALIFGFLGVLKLRNEINCFSSVTGAKKDHSSGVIYNI
jgi:anhydro-N-acetylmuramic acid kinase